jgi:glutathione S-transferase
LNARCKNHNILQGHNKKMVQLTVYGDMSATCTQRILILLEELELKYDLKPVHLAKGEHREESFMQMNPFGKVPVMVYGERTLFESRSILRYIAKKNSEEVDLEGDAYTDMWLEIEGQNFNPPASAILYEKLWKGGEADDEVVNENVAKLEKVLDIYEARLVESKYIGGEAFTIADISNIPYAYALLKCGFKDMFKKRPAVYSWLKKIMRRDAVRVVLEKRLTYSTQKSDTQESI